MQLYTAARFVTQVAESHHRRLRRSLISVTEYNAVTSH